MKYRRTEFQALRTVLLWFILAGALAMVQNIEAAPPGPAIYETNSVFHRYGTPYATWGSPLFPDFWGQYRKYQVDAAYVGPAPPITHSTVSSNRVQFDPLRQGCAAPGACAFIAPGLFVGPPRMTSIPTNERLAMVQSERFEDGSPQSFDIRVGFFEHHAGGDGNGLHTGLANHGGENGFMDPFDGNWKADGISWHFGVRWSGSNWTASAKQATLFAADSSLPEHMRSNYANQVSSSGGLGTYSNTNPLYIAWDLTTIGASNRVQVGFGDVACTNLVYTWYFNKNMTSPSNSDAIAFQNSIFDPTNVVPMLFSGWDFFMDPTNNSAFQTWQLHGADLGSLPTNPPVISTHGVSNVTERSATLYGFLASTGAAPTTVYLAWGTNDELESWTEWDTLTNLGTPPLGTISNNLTGLEPDTTYYYRFAATNLYGYFWASAASNFTTATGPTNGVDLAINKTASTNSLMIGTNLTYTIDVTNLTSVAAGGVVVTDSLPANVLFLTARPDASVTNGHEYSFDLGILAGFAQTSITINISVTSSVPGAITNFAVVTTTNSETILANNRAMAVTTLPDTDNDGLANPGDPDDDNDGFPDCSEVIANTDQLNPLSLLWLQVQRTTTPNFYELTFPATTGRVYSIQGSTNLYIDQWLNVQTNIPGIPGLLTVSETNVSDRTYYRVGVEIP